eukprot:CAMPEP_0204647740 /NCGR_PEP_ID=MMETSP0718-20130828/6672_1 /ASSEMBLY_ACC=CAM_ASM_000674 /TAXON_ID=230516 /ORGANISM="Chaetoceros curvisetus" /LENGTH=103 /DNA_ID=CAMNT_0051670391 /DNA_START=372 /DNA_END=683 /DNA_ORIENTATION=+
MQDPDKLRPLDILLGRGGVSNNHCGNRVYRDLLDGCKSRYQILSTKNEKKRFTSDVLKYIKGPNYGGGRFVEPSATTSGYPFREISDQRARVKISQFLREKKK